MDQGNLQRIAFVTRRFTDLQGLRAVAYGAALLVGASIHGVIPGDSFSSPMLGIVMFATLLAGAARVPLDRYYRRTFGTLAVRSSTLQPGTRYGSLPDLVVSGLVIDLIFASMFAPRIGLGGVVLLGLSLRIVIRDWPQRPYYAIGTAAGVASAVVAALAPPRGSSRLLLDPASGQSFAVACGLIGLALVVIGLLDHRLLVHAMWRGRTADAVERLPPQRLATTRIVLAGSLAATLLVHSGVREWPSHDSIMMGMFAAGLFLLVVAGCWPDLLYGLRVFNEAERARKAALLARIEGRQPPRIDTPPMSGIPRPDLWGHVVLPAAIACGAFADATVRVSGLPSFLALALAASHLRIAIRDWPDRKHYLLGAAAAAVGAVQHMFIPPISLLDWALSFLMLLSTAMLIEGLLDRRLESDPPTFSDDRHAHTV